MRTPKILTLLALATLAAFAAMPARADSKDETCTTKDGKTAPKGDPSCKPADAPVAFTNDDLDRLFGGSSAPNVSVEQATRAKEGAQPDYLGVMREEQRNAAAQAQNIEVAKAKVAEAEQRVKSLEARNVQIANPFLPRPTLSPEEQKDWADKDNVARMQANQAEIDQAKKDAEQAKEDLAHAESGGQ